MKLLRVEISEDERAELLAQHLHDLHRYLDSL